MDYGLSTMDTIKKSKYNLHIILQSSIFAPHLKIKCENES
ncbi:hypothetical protein Solca_0783 [Solitalea canadensis DSM 3403]|uniref:Uncharacterized protein n=1 Tax=Solitalea canadensis (strain ATCC 29591 / DSM 3403 / JCM 21819 / LMG 8368 / NBRC 15130 / NCIMB 12057 / USAM 9D) TaxID=929556 RepID=H8KPK4_SOLCM|nr:hypothetical protein Solca_0783 [Solitalea canadensis DSM 3403]